MLIELLSSPGCPHAAAARRTVTACLTTIGIEAPIVDRVGRYPSPMVLVDGIDVMRPNAGPIVGDACRLDLPTSQRVLDALCASAQAGVPQSVAESAAHLPPAIRALHRAVLRAFIDFGRADRDDLRPAAEALGLAFDDALRRLAAADLVHADADGRVVIAYPFSARPTGHIVHLAGRHAVAAMCAIDALGIPLMTGTDGNVDSADPETGTSIRIERQGNSWAWHPDTTVVLIGGTDACGTLADSVCRSITFHTDRESARSHLANHPELHGVVVGQADAVTLAERAFGSLLAS